MEPTFRHVATADLTRGEIDEIRALLWAAFDSEDEDERMTEDDWQHALGGVHVIGEVDGRIVAFASIVERELHVDGRPVRTGYVEAVGVLPGSQRLGIGTRLMRHVNAGIRAGFEMGCLATGVGPFYERLGWEVWHGPTSVRTATGDTRTPDEDGYILVLRTPASPPLDLAAPISAPWRVGDGW